uniref:RNA helicase n=1 Tax=Chromera velia CCMP2878 TaxID=1169474 RepID=A0A0G4FNU8_9ALVE|eukprot:Cvel_17988.t1-p1 / transcript=Cvel_17988.t1 / gene=Cvel_17988 / organism=Chromera_velia_CCMP2878 / gene_product=ATP-dependent RNA helicase RhlE, putative / transcript_product=ATP-dependent RNA helicase RhlE, putative / location=Cvel_scaffold1465:39082-42019(+) / protein_length=720 / sequence_SO=supercontig / SO=protein_coding / is_pseudo=false
MSYTLLACLVALSTSVRLASSVYLPLFKQKVSSVCFVAAPFSASPSQARRRVLAGRNPKSLLAIGGDGDGQVLSPPKRGRAPPAGSHGHTKGKANGSPVSEGGGDFGSLGLHPALLRATTAMRYADPTPIQQKSIPPAMEGKDVVAAATTGSGKTAAFLLPVLHQILLLREKSALPQRRLPGATVLILTPTRELASQILEQCNRLSQFVSPPIRAGCVFGGVKMGPQEMLFRQGTDVMIACPGRLMDHLENHGHYATLDRVQFLILDEADRMLDMGFVRDVKKVLKYIPGPFERQQTAFFSATMPKEVIDLASQITRGKSYTAQVDTDRIAAPAQTVAQTCWEVPENAKQLLLLELLKRGIIDSGCICFCRTKHRVKRLTKYLKANGINAVEMHGNRSQGQRENALEDFKRGKARCLVATDVVARGIDIEQLGHVVIFDVPEKPDDYIHRVGRTGRAAKSGEAFTFVTPNDRSEWAAIENVVRRGNLVGAGVAGRQGTGVIPRRRLDNFDYSVKETEALEIPAEERMRRHREQMFASRLKAAQKRFEELRRRGVKLEGKKPEDFATIKGLERLKRMVEEGTGFGGGGGGGTTTDRRGSGKGSGGEARPVPLLWDSLKSKDGGMGASPQGPPPTLLWDSSKSKDSGVSALPPNEMSRQGGQRRPHESRGGGKGGGGRGRGGGGGGGRPASSSHIGEEGRQKGGGSRERGPSSIKRRESDIY